ncbi:kinase-like domain-containing protein [Flagelloscypha sp. PMI_526]|nr:kinase-like domain-containing protein [Flagelloscypha sp. PMI_526]
MSTTTASWVTRQFRLAELLNSEGDEDDDGIALDRLLHGQNVIARSSKTTEIEDLRFQSRDMRVLGTLEAGQFGLVDVVNCRLDGTLYVRKSIEKRLALRAPEQCSPLSERTILLEARKLHATWVPHLLCAYQTTTHLAMVMTYEPGGNLWNVFETAPAGVIPESDLLWWMPQIISALFWLHEQGFVHRDVKPHNFVLSETSHIKLIDFGSVAPFDQETRKVESKYCSMMCGTCDYVSPEILRAHEEAFVALEMESDAERERHRDAYVVYGVEMDWWSFGAMIYEL